MPFPLNLNQTMSAQAFYIVGVDGKPVSLSSNSNAAGSAATDNPTVVAGTDSGNIVRRLRTDTSGILSVNISNISANNSGTADVGGLLKVGGVFTDGGMGVVSSGQRINLRLDETGNMRTLLVGPTTTAGALDSIGATTYASGNANGSAFPATLSAGNHVYDAGAAQWRPMKGDTNGSFTRLVDGTGNKILTVNPSSDYDISLITPLLGVYSQGALFDGTRSVRTRGNEAGAFTQGNVASGAADSGNPLKMGAVYNSVTPVAVVGARQDLQTSSNGSLFVDFARAANQRSPTTDANTASTGLNTYSQGMVFNGTTWDRMRGDTDGTYMAATSKAVDSQTALAANATFTGTGRGAAGRYSFFVADVYTDQAGTLFVERSTNGTTWIPANGLAGQAVAAGQSLQVKIPTTTANYRSRYVNGGTAQTVFLLTNALSLN